MQVGQALSSLSEVRAGANAFDSVEYFDGGNYRLVDGGKDMTVVVSSSERSPHLQIASI
jgi:hypothetical protein